MFENLGFQEITLIAIVFLVFFGPKKIPEVMNGIGRGVREFRRAMADVKGEISNIASVPLDDTTIHRAAPVPQAAPKADTAAPPRSSEPSAAPPVKPDADTTPDSQGTQSPTGE